MNWEKMLKALNYEIVTVSPKQHELRRNGECARKYIGDYRFAAAFWADNLFNLQWVAEKVLDCGFTFEVHVLEPDSMYVRVQKGDVGVTHYLSTLENISISIVGAVVRWREIFEGLK